MYKYVVFKAAGKGPKKTREMTERIETGDF